MRACGNEGDDGYDIEAILNAAQAEGVGRPDGRGGITGAVGFGGEFLLTPLKDIERMLERFSQLKAPFTLQTNGALITRHHIELFKKYNMTSIGVSIDGPGDLNDTRKVKGGTIEATRKATANTEKNIELLMAAGIAVSLILTIYATNTGTDEKLDRLIAWLLEMRDKGVRTVNLHLLEPHGPDTLGMLQERQIEVFRRLRRELVGFQSVSPFSDMRAKLAQSGQSHCTFNFCSPYSTPAVTAIDGTGQAARCGRLNNDGVAYERSKQQGHERYVALYHTPQEYDGCQGCKFFTSCGGHCPGEGEDGDWRNKTVHCKTLYALFEDIEEDLMEEGIEPISSSNKRPAVEVQLLAQWTGQVIPLTLVPGDRPHGDVPHGDHTDTQRPIITHGDSDE